MAAPCCFIHCPDSDLRPFSQSTVYDERENALQIFWKRGVDVLAYLTETNEDEHLKRLRANAQHHAKLMEADSGKGDAENALFDDDEEEAGPEGAAKLVLDTEQHRKSRDVSLLHLISL